MIFKTTYQTGKTGGHTKARTQWLGETARRSLNVLLSELYQPVTQDWLNRNIPDIEAANGLHLVSGSAEGSQMPTAMQVRESIHFVKADVANWQTGQAFDFVYTRIWAGGLSGLGSLLEVIRQNLRAGGNLFLEVAPLSGFSAYPYNHALARSMELIGLLETPRRDVPALPERVQIQLQQACFDTLELVSCLPAFMPRSHNRVVSLAVESCREAILHFRSSTAEELNALLIELREFEKQEDTLISRPGMYMLRAWLPPPLKKP